MIKSFKFLGFVIFATGLFLLAQLLMIDYDGFINSVMDLSNIPLSKKDKLTAFLSPSKFNLIKLIPAFFIFIGVLFFFSSKWLAVSLQKGINWLKSLWLYLVSFPRTYLYAVLSIISFSLAFSIYNVVHEPIYYDEAWTYLNFTKRNILSSISYYPAPNNHILHSVFTNLTFWFPFSNTINLRLPALILSLLNSFSVFFILSKTLNKKIALLLLAIFCFSFPFLHYSYQSRGYLLLLFSFTLCFYAILKLCYPEKDKQSYTKYLYLLSLGAILGFYTMPSFLYPYLSCFSFAFVFLIRKKKNKKAIQLLVSSAISAIIVVCLYLPIFLISGIDSIINSSITEPISRMEVLEKLIPHFSASSDFLFNLPLYASIPLLLIFAFLLIFKKKNEISFPLYCILIAPFILVLHSVVPFPRTWIYLILPFLFLLGVTIQHFNIHEKLSFRSTAILSIVTIAFLLINFNQKSIERKTFPHLANQLSKYLESEKATNVYCNHPLIETCLLYLFEERNVSIGITYSIAEIDSQEVKNIQACCDFAITDKKLNNVNGLSYIDNWGKDIFLSKVNHTNTLSEKPPSSRK